MSIVDFGVKTAESGKKIARPQERFVVGKMPARDALNSLPDTELPDGPDDAALRPGPRGRPASSAGPRRTRRSLGLSHSSDSQHCQH